MISIKRILSAATAAVLIWQTASGVYAGWEPDTENTYEIYSTDFSDYVPGEVVGDKQLYQPEGWTIEKMNSDWDLKAYADIVTESIGSMSGVPYLRIYNTGEQKLSESIKAEKAFEIPADSTGIVRARFKFSTNHGNYAAEVKITDGNNKGITVSSGWDGEWKSETGEVDGKKQETFGEGQWRIFVNDLLGTGNSGKFAIGTANGSDDSTWRNFEIAVNTSDNKVTTEIAGQSITLGGRIYAVAMTCGGETNILKGILPRGTGNFCKFSLTTPGWFQGSEVRLDNVSIEYTPIVYIDNKFTNKALIKCGDKDVAEPSDIGSEIRIENKLMNKSLSDKDAVVLAAVYRNGYMINSAAGFAEKVPHSVDGDENVYKQLDITMNTPPENIFGDMNLKVFTLDSFDKIEARCGALSIAENSEKTEFTEVTENPLIDESTNIMTYCGRNEPESNVTYAVIKKDTELKPDMTAKDFCDSLYYFNETASDKEGKYAFDIKFAGTDAEYTLIVNDGTELKQYPITFKNKIADVIADEINDITDIDEFKTKLDLYLESVMFSNSIYNSNIDEIKSGDAFYKLFLDEIKKNPVTSSDDVLKNAEICTLMFGLSKTEDKSDFEQLLKNNIDMLPVSRVYANELYSDGILTDDVVKSVIFGKLAASAIDNKTMLEDVEKFLDGFGDSTLLAVCEKTVGAAAGKRIIEVLNTQLEDTSFAKAYQKYSDLSSTKRDAAASAIMGRTYSSIEKLADAFITAVNSSGNSNQSSGGGGGGGGSAVIKPSGGSTGSPTMNFPAEDKEPALTPPEYELPSQGEKVSFADLNDAAWAESFVTKLSERGIISGDDNGNFCPNKTILREEFVKMLVKLLGIDTLYVGSNFDDVPVDSWYYEYVSAAYANGIVNGTDSKSFGAGQNITREDMCVMIYRALKKYGVYIQNTESEPFKDDAELSSYARDGVYTLKKLGAIDGFSDGTFAPQRNASRAETAKILSTVLDYLETESNPKDEEVSNK